MMIFMLIALIAIARMQHVYMRTTLHTYTATYIDYIEQIVVNAH